VLQQEATRWVTGLLPAYWKHAIDESVWNLHQPFPGFSTDSPFGAQLVFDDALVREIPDRQLRRMVRADTVSATKDGRFLRRRRPVPGRHRALPRRDLRPPGRAPDREGHPPAQESTAENEEDTWSDHHAGRTTSRPRTCWPLSGAALFGSDTSGAAGRQR
jgi:hypothetical protein